MSTPCTPDLVNLGDNDNYDVVERPAGRKAAKKNKAKDLGNNVIESPLRRDKGKEQHNKWEENRDIREILSSRGTEDWKWGKERGTKACIGERERGRENHVNGYKYDASIASIIYSPTSDANPWKKELIVSI